MIGDYFDQNLRYYAASVLSLRDFNVQATENILEGIAVAILTLSTSVLIIMSTTCTSTKFLNEKKAHSSGRALLANVHAHHVGH